MGLREGIGVSLFRANDESSIDRGSEPRAVGVPPKSSFLSLNREPVSVTLTGPDGALGDEFWPISPSSSHLPHSMPIPTNI